MRSNYNVTVICLALVVSIYLIFVERYRMKQNEREIYYEYNNRIDEARDYGELVDIINSL